jgi:hypothetical protein
MHGKFVQPSRACSKRARGRALVGWAKYGGGDFKPIFEMNGATRQASGMCGNVALLKIGCP